MKRLKVLLIIYQIFLLIKQVEAKEIMDRCIEYLDSKSYVRAIDDSKAHLKKDKWNAEAYSCLSIAYYLKGNREYALKKLKEAEETIPSEYIEKIHDLLWKYLPELLAEKEFIDNYTLKGGACILRNLTSIKGSGLIEIGFFYNPDKDITDRHLRAFKCEKEKDCIIIDHICPQCILREREVLLIIEDFEIKEVKRMDKNSDLSKNIRYIRKILSLQKEEL